MLCFSISFRFGFILHLFATTFQSCIGQREVRHVVLQHQLSLWLQFVPALHQHYTSFHLRYTKATPDLEVRHVRNAMLQHQLSLWLQFTSLVTTCQSCIGQREVRTVMLQHQLSLWLQFTSLCHYMLELHRTTRGKKCRALALAFALAFVHTSVTPALHQFSPALHQGCTRFRGKRCKKCNALASGFALALVYISLSLHARAAQDNAK